MFPETDPDCFVNVVLPLAIPQTYTYAVPGDMVADAAVGKRVVVQFGKRKVYSAIIESIHDQKPERLSPKPIICILDEKPVLTITQLKLWQWMAGYYCCKIGEVMLAALPTALKLASETKLILNPAFGEDFSDLNNEEYMLAEALSLRKELSIDDVQAILDKKTVYPVIQSLLQHQVAFVKEELKDRYKPKLQSYVKAGPQFLDKEQQEAAFDALRAAPRQLELLMAYIHLSNKLPQVPKASLLHYVGASANIYAQLEKKGLLTSYSLSVSRLEDGPQGASIPFELSPAQENALKAIKAEFTRHPACLLHGVTGSGKTEIYIRLMEEQLSQGKQVLYLLPEIALTAQIILRLRKVFGKRIGIYHSKFSNNERVEIWHKVLEGSYDIVVGARSTLFLPLENPGLIIVDEEHDSSYKQYEPAPRYHARDAAVYLAQLHQCPILLGTATPSLESYHNVKSGKYGIVELSERFGGIQLPEIALVDLKEAARKKQMKSLFSSTLLHAMKAVLAKNEQVILFQNRRGYSPFLLCATCGWIPRCKNCDVSLTYHKIFKELRCHYCGYREKELSNCLACSSTHLQIQGFGTEKIEDELQLFLPEAQIQRMDLDTVKSKHGHEKIITAFEAGSVDILVGTQMVTKGLDFDNVSLVGILSADQLLNFPDFRASERAFQLMAQVSGRSGRKKKRGKVIIQVANIDHPVIGFILKDDYINFYGHEVMQRQMLKYPPFYRLIKLTLKHRKAEVVTEGARQLAVRLKKVLGRRLLGPALPMVPRIRNYYLRDLLIKLHKEQDSPVRGKQIILDAVAALQTETAFKSLIVVIDVDPM